MWPTLIQLKTWQAISVSQTYLTHLNPSFPGCFPKILCLCTYLCARLRLVHNLVVGQHSQKCLTNSSRLQHLYIFYIYTFTFILQALKRTRTPQFDWRVEHWHIPTFLGELHQFDRLKFTYSEGPQLDRNTANARVWDCIELNCMSIIVSAETRRLRLNMARGQISLC